MKRITLLSLVLFWSTGAQAQEAIDRTALYERAAPAVVRVHTRSGNGTAFLVGPTTLATSWHVVDARSELWVKTWDGTEIPVELVSRSRKDDVALLELPEPLVVSGEVVEPLPLAEASPPVGASIVAIGHPLAGGGLRQGPLLEGLLTWSLTEGFVSKVGERALQVSATVEPGNSGGPLLDRHGRVVGVVGFTVGRLGGATRVERLSVLLADDDAAPTGPTVDGALLLGMNVGLEPGRSLAEGTHLGLYAGGEVLFNRRLSLGYGLEASWLVSQEARDAGKRSNRMLFRTTVGPRFELPFRPSVKGPLAVTPYGLVGLGYAREGLFHETANLVDPECDLSLGPCSVHIEDDTVWGEQRWMPMLGGGVRFDVGPTFYDVSAAVNPMNPQEDLRVLLQFGIRF